MHLNRRHFIYQSAVALAASTCPLRAAATPRRSIGYGLYAMKSLPIGEAIDQCKRIGYDSVELCIMPDFPTDLPKFTPAVRREVRDRLRSTGLGMPSLEIAINAGEANQTPALDLIKGCAEVAHDLDDRHPPFIETVCGGKTPDWDKTKDKIAANLRRWAETAAAGGVKIAVKNHFGHVNNTPERMLWLRRTVNHPSFLLSYDYGHYQAEGLDLEATLREMIPHTSFIHVKDIVPGTKPPKYLPPGEGKIDYVKYFRLLRELNYTGPVVVEISAQIHRLPGYQPIPTAEKCHAFLRQAQQASLA